MPLLMPLIIQGDILKAHSGIEQTLLRNTLRRHVMIHRLPGRRAGLQRT